MRKWGENKEEKYNTEIQLSWYRWGSKIDFQRRRRILPETQGSFSRGSGENF